MAIAGIVWAAAWASSGCAGIPDPPEPLSLELPAPEPPASPPPAPAGDEVAAAARSDLPRPPRLPLPEPFVEWWPPRPVPASAVLFRVHAPAGPPLEDVTLRFAGQELRAVPAVSVWRGIGSLPLDSAGVFELDIDFTRQGRREARRFVMPVRERIYPSTRIRISARPSADPEVDARIEREREMVRGALVSSGSTWLPRGPFGWPRQPPIETSPFGQRRLFEGSVRSRHLGLDLRARLGNPIRAPAAGRVLLAGDFVYQGKAVYLDHGLGLVTAYFHMSSIDVGTGDLVAQGDLIGRGGSTGRSTAPHLHWSAYVGGRSIDPETLVGLELDPIPAGTTVP